MGIKEMTPRRRAFRYEAADESTPIRAEFDEVTEVWSVTIGDLTYTLGKTPPWMVRELVVVHGNLYDKANPVEPKPRELETLDGDEARDGTVWGFDYRPGRTGYLCYTLGAWLFSAAADRLNGDGGVHISPDHYFFNSGPYTEVVK